MAGHDFPSGLCHDLCCSHGQLHQSRSVPFADWCRLVSRAIQGNQSSRGSIDWHVSCQCGFGLKIRCLIFFAWSSFSMSWFFSTTVESCEGFQAFSDTHNMLRYASRKLGRCNLLHTCLIPGQQVRCLPAFRWGAQEANSDAGGLTYHTAWNMLKHQKSSSMSARKLLFACFCCG